MAYKSLSGTNSGGGGSLEVSDGTHNVNNVTEIIVSGGSVSGSTPTATITITGGGTASISKSTFLIIG